MGTMVWTNGDHDLNHVHYGLVYGLRRLSIALTRCNIEHGAALDVFNVRALPDRTSDDRATKLKVDAWQNETEGSLFCCSFEQNLIYFAACVFIEQTFWPWTKSCATFHSKENCIYHICKNPWPLHRTVRILRRGPDPTFIDIHCMKTLPRAPTTSVSKMVGVGARGA